MGQSSDMRTAWRLGGPLRRFEARDEPRRDVVVEGHVVPVVDTGGGAADGGDAGRCFVLVHGIGASSRYFLPLVRALQPDARVLAMDLPGFGGSPRPQRVLTIPDLARVVGAVVEQSNVTRAVLVGHSMGCQVVAELDAQQPGLAGGLVLVGPTVDPGNRSPLRHFLMLAHNSLYEPWWVNAVLTADYLRCGIRHYVRTLRPMLTHRIERLLTTSPTPAVVVRGSRDRVAGRRWSTSAARMLARGRVVEIPHQAHGVHASDPEGVAAICRELLAG